MPRYNSVNLSVVARVPCCLMGGILFQKRSFINFWISLLVLFSFLFLSSVLWFTFVSKSFFLKQFFASILLSNDYCLRGYRQWLVLRYMQPSEWTFCIISVISNKVSSFNISLKASQLVFLLVCLRFSGPFTSSV